MNNIARNAKCQRVLVLTVCLVTYCLHLQVHLRSAERLREMCCRNGGCFIKVGQHIGALDYLLPAEYVNTMKVLHQYAPESSIADIKRIIAADLGHTVDELFASFEECPIASASLAQVHRATTRGSGAVVAVKVQHPHIKSHSAVDMATMEVKVCCQPFLCSIVYTIILTWLSSYCQYN